MLRKGLLKKRSGLERKRWITDNLGNHKGSPLDKKTFSYINNYCPKKCYKNVSHQEQGKLFYNFYALADNSKQNIYLKISFVIWNDNTKNECQECSYFVGILSFFKWRKGRSL